MSDLTPERLREIYRDAGKATPGPWHWMRPGIDYYEVLSDTTSVAADMLTEDDARHIANMDGDTTRGLVAEVNRLRIGAESLRIQRDIMISELEKARWAIERVKDIHRKGDVFGREACLECGNHDYPCDTIRALGEGV